MATLVIGASGATGKHMVGQLLQAGQKVKVIVRPTSPIPEYWNKADNLTIIKANITEISVEEMAEYLSDCRAVASCLGHNLTLTGVFGKPRKLVADAVHLLCQAILKNTPTKPVKFVQMNTIGIRNLDLGERISFAQQIVIGLVRLFVPPQSDSEKAATHLRVGIGQKHPSIEWVVVRPDSLVDDENVMEYTLHPSPTSSLFNPRKTSRINVAHFIASLIGDDQIWDTWKGQMPVIYNEISGTKKV